MRHVYSFLGDKNINTMLIVLPNIPWPHDDRWRVIFSGPMQSIVPSLFGPELIELRRKMTPHIRRSMFGGSGELVDVGFHPIVGGSNWAPFPTIQLIKSRVFDLAENWYEKTTGNPVSKIVDDNFIKFMECEQSETKKMAIIREQLACYDILKSPV
jgi:hypothetical protein